MHALASLLIPALLVVGSATAAAQATADAAASAPANRPAEQAPSAAAADPAAAPGVPAPAVTADAAREAEFAAAIGAQRDSGEILKLGAAPAQFIALFQPAAGAAALGAVLILHDLGRHPDWPAVIRPLRLGLPPGGFATLAIQLPVLPAAAPRAGYGALVAEAVTRVRAGLADLQARAPGPVAIVGHGLGALAALRCVAQDGCGAAALALIGLPAGDELAPPADPLADLGQAALPVLDLYASRDAPDVLRLAAQRARIGRKASGAWRQVALDAADHDHGGGDEALVRYVRGWLAKTFTSAPPAPAGPGAAPPPGDAPRPSSAREG